MSVHVSEAAAGFVATVQHAAACWTKVETLQQQVRVAMEVAADLMPQVDDATLDDAWESLKAAGVPGRRALAHEMSRRVSRPRSVPPGESVRRTRGSTETWPTAPSWVYVLIGSATVQGARPGKAFGLTPVRAFSDDRQILYVGKSNTPKSRLTVHSNRGIPWVEAELIACASEADALRLEGDLIYQHQPPWNLADKRQRRWKVA